MTSPLQNIVYARGALVATSATGTKRSIAFQYNPETIRRTLEPNVVGGKQGSRSQAVRYAGAPVETITIDCRFSATGDQNTGADAGTQGIAPQLAALALFAYPSTADVLAAQELLDKGVIEVTPALADPLLFVFGPQRLIPCQIDSFSIVEQLYDADLTPVMATVSLTLRAISYSDVSASNPSFHQFIAYQQALEQMGADAYDGGS